jgi:hypothetical protein
LSIRGQKIVCGDFYQFKPLCLCGIQNIDQGTNPRKTKKGWSRGSVAPINFMSNTAKETEDQVQQIYEEEINRAFNSL